MPKAVLTSEAEAALFMPPAERDGKTHYLLGCWFDWFSDNVQDDVIVSMRVIEDDESPRGEVFRATPVA